MQKVNPKAYRETMDYESIYAFSIPDSQKQVSSVEQHPQLENSQSYYDQRGADKRKKLFNQVNNAELDNIKDKRDDDLIDFQSNHQIEMFSTRNNYNNYDLKSPKESDYSLNSPKEKQSVQQRNSELLSNPFMKVPTNTKLNINVPKGMQDSTFDDRFSPYQIMQARKQSFRMNTEINWQRGKDENSIQSNNYSMNYNASNLIGHVSHNQSQFIPNKEINTNGVQNTMQASTYNMHTTQNQGLNAAYKNIMKMSNVRQFFQKMCQLSLSYNTKQLKQRHFQLVNDSSYYHQEEQVQKRFTASGNLQTISEIKFILALNWVLQLIPVLNPETFGCVFWDILYGMSVLVYLFFIPMNISFSITCIQLQNTIIFFQIMNVLVSFMRGFYQNGTLILERKQIALNYIKQSFLFDLFIIAILHWYHDIMCWMFFANIRQLQTVVERADNYFQIIRRHPTVYEISHLIISILLIGQITGCGFHFIAKLEVESDSNAKTWLQIDSIQQYNHWAERYIASEYFAFITMITVGYGDIYPTTTVERVYVIFMTLCSSAVFGYVMNTIGSIVKKNAQKHSYLQKRKQDITSYMNDRNIDRSIQIKILRFLDFQSTVERKNLQTIEVLFKDVPKSFTAELYQEYFGKIIQKNKILSLNFSKESLIDLSMTIKEKFLQPNEYLIQKGTQEEKVYFLLYGSLQVILDTPHSSPVVFQQITAVGECIGLRNAFNENEYSYDIKAGENTTAQLFYFEMKDFKEIVSKNQKDFEKFCELKDEITFGHQYLDTKCISCDRFNHAVENCPLIHPNISKPNTIMRFSHNNQQERNQLYKRREPKNYYRSTKGCLNRMRIFVKSYRFELSIKQYPEYEQFRDLIMHYDDERFAMELPEFIEKEGSIILNEDDEYNGDEPDLPQDINELLVNVNNNPVYINNKNSDQSIQTYIDSIIQNNNNIPLVHSQLNMFENTISPLTSNQQNLLLNPPTLIQTSSQIKIPTFQNPLHQYENIIESNLVLQQKDSIKEFTSRSLVSKRDRGDSQYIKKPQNSIISQQYPLSAGLQQRTSRIRKQTQRHQTGMYFQEHAQQQINNPEEQNQNNDHRLYFYKHFEILKNFTKYFPKGNSDVVIKKFNSIQSAKKNLMLKTTRINQNTPNNRLKRFFPRRSMIPSNFKTAIIN